MMYIALANLDFHIPNVFKQVISRTGFNERLICIDYRSYITSIKELSGNEIYDLLIVFSTFFMDAPLEMVALTTLPIY